MDQYWRTLIVKYNKNNFFTFHESEIIRNVHKERSFNKLRNQIVMKY